MCERRELRSGFIYDPTRIPTKESMMNVVHSPKAGSVERKGNSEDEASLAAQSNRSLLELGTDGHFVETAQTSHDPETGSRGYQAGTAATLIPLLPIQPIVGIIRTRVESVPAGIAGISVFATRNAIRSLIQRLLRVQGKIT